MNNFFLVTSIDPTRTLTIRNKFVSAMRTRFNSLMADIKQALIDQDVMGLETTNKPLKFNASNLSPRQFNFPTSAQKVEAFAKWINEQAKRYLLSNGREGMGVSGEVSSARESWIKLYIDSAYQQGIRRARQELKKKGVEIDDGALGGDPIRVAFNSMVHADRVGLIYSRAYSSLKSITAEMDSVVSDVLALGIADGRGPKQIARMLDKVITGRGESLEILDSLGRKIPSLRRAEILARTEVIRSHHSANIGEYRAAGAMGITVLAEHLTAGDDRVCPKCAPLNGKQYTIEEAEYIIPVHPQCRCVALPYIPEDSPGRQVAPKAVVQPVSKIEKIMPEKLTPIPTENIFHHPPVNLVVGFSNSDLKKFRDAKIDFDRIIPGQEFVNKEYVEKYRLETPEELPRVIKIPDGRIIAVDHTRLAAQAENGKKIVDVKIAEFVKNDKGKWILRKIPKNESI